ncbi:MAG: hypothetical protein ABW168_02380 [Sedimenticola sp.]
MSISPTSISTLLLAALLTSGCSQIREGDSRPSYLSGAESRALFSGHTVEAFNLNTGTTSFTYYTKNGEVRQERLWAYRQGNWRINKAEEICLQFGKRKEGCRIIGKRRGVYRKYRMEKDGKLKPVVRYRRFLPGNVLNL